MTLSGIFRDLLPLQTRLLGRGGVSGGEQPTNRSSTLTTCARNALRLSDRARLRVWRPRPFAYSAMRMEPTGLERQPPRSTAGILGPTKTNSAEAYASSQVLRLRPRRRRPQARPDGCSRACLSDVKLDLSESRIGRTGRHHHRPLLRHPGRHRSSRSAGRSRVGAFPVYIGDPDPGSEGDGAHAGSEQVVFAKAGRASLNPKWYEDMLEPWLRRRPSDRSPHHQHAWAGRRRPDRWQPWVYQEPLGDLRARPRDA